MIFMKYFVCCLIILVAISGTDASHRNSKDASENIQTYDDYVDDMVESRDRRDVENEEDDELLDRTERSASWNSKRGSPKRRSTPRCHLSTSGQVIRCDRGSKIRGAGQTGRPGSPGLPGPKVGKGDRGERGSPGRPGPDGPVGARGRRGPPGTQGSKGANGDKGDRGRIGQQGYPGVPTNCRLLREPINNCKKGESGTKGVKGSVGEEGAVGMKGDQGPTGYHGDKGNRGASGIPGGIGLYGTLRLKGACRQLQSPWVVPNRSPIGQLKTECAFREYLLSLAIESDKKDEKIRYNYKCCPFKAANMRFSL